ncbi:MAG: ORF6N domain-containing protein [Candidatus Binatia bacterium]
MDAALQRIEAAILVVRGHRVLLDADLALLYGVPPKRLNEQVRRNHERFPDDFMFQLTGDEVASFGPPKPSRSTSRSCEPSSAYDGCCKPTSSWLGSSWHWRRSTTRNSASSSMPSAN